MDEATVPWIDSMEVMLGSLHNKRVQPCSIYMVPEQLRKSKVEAYMPKVISIGPIHKGTRKELEYMEQIKWQCMLYLLNRSSEDPRERLRKCSQAMLDLNEIVRATYGVDGLKFKGNDLANIMVLDGCFLLELLISGSEELNCELKSCLDYPSPGAEVIKREDVLVDLTMLENQIPLLVLEKLSILLFHDAFIMETFHDFALSLLGYNPGPNSDGVYDLIGLVHGSFIDDGEEEIHGNEDLSIPVASEEVSVKLKRCATSLQADGVTIKARGAEANDIEVVQRRGRRELVKKNPTPLENRFDLNIRFGNGKLEIPQLHITKRTEDKWRNFIAWEVNRTDMQSFISRKGDPRTECKFISYALFFKSLICCVDDIQLLRDREVIVVHERNKEGKMKAMSNYDLLTFFRELTDGIPDDLSYVDPSFRELFNALNSHPRAWCHPTIIWHTFRYYSITLFTYWLRIFTRDHRQWKIMGTLGIVLTAIQTYYSIRPK